jgi:hypothetical protein
MDTVADNEQRAIYVQCIKNKLSCACLRWLSWQIN